jgi:hypothetical protein
MNPRLIRHTRSALLITAVIAAASLAGAAPPTEITIPGPRIFPESLTSTSDGTVIIGSIGTRQIFRAKPGAPAAEPWISPGTAGIQSIFGVVADTKSSTLYACSNAASPPGSQTFASGTLYTFDLTSGAPKGRYPFPTPGALCNDIAVGSDGTAYATDTNNMEVVRLKKDATALEVWAGHGGFGPKEGPVDGIAVLGNRLLIGTLGTGKLFSVPIQADGSAGKIVELLLDRTLQRPDGMRAFGRDTLLVAETGGTGQLARLVAWFYGGAGRLSKVRLRGNTGTVITLKQGYADGPVSVTVVGTTAYVLEGQLAGFFRAPNTPPPDPKPFRATAVEVGKP